MKDIRIYLIFLVMAVVAAMVFAGCATLEKSRVSNVEGMLAKAGFQKQVADTPQKLAHLKTLAQNRFSRHQRHGKPYLVYADAAGCKCLYSGDEEAFQRFRGLERLQSVDYAKANKPGFQTDWTAGFWGPFE